MERFSFSIHPESQRILETIGLLKNESGNGLGDSSKFSPSRESFKRTERRDSDAEYANRKASPPFSYKEHSSSNGHAQPRHKCGVHALLSSSSTNYLEVVDLPSGGQLWSQRVRIGDKLVTVDGMKVETFEAAQNAVEGSHGSVVELGFFRERGAPREFEVDVVRTLNIGEDVELAVYKELGRLLESDDSKFETRRVDSVSEEGRFVNVVHDDIFSKVSSLLHTVQQQEAFQEAKTSEIERLQNSLARAQKELSRLQPDKVEQLHREIERLRGKEVVGMALSLDGSDDLKQLADMGGLEEQLRNDIAQSLKVDKNRIELIGMQRRGQDSRWEMDLNILKCTGPGEPAAEYLANEMIEQAQNSKSALHNRPSTSAITGARKVDGHKVVELLRQRVAELQLKLKSADDDYRRREAELAAQYRAFENHSQNEMLRLRTEAETHGLKVQSLTSSLSKASIDLQEQELKGRKFELELNKRNEECRNLKQEVQRFKDALSASTAREAVAQQEMVVLSQRHQEVFLATERALDDAKNSLASRKGQSEDIAVLNQKLQLAEESRVQTQQKHNEQMFLLQDRITKMTESFSKERAEFLSHLKASEESVRHLRSVSEGAARAQEDLSKQLAMEKEVSLHNAKQRDVYEKAARSCKDELEKARLSNVFLQNEVAQLSEEVAQLKIRERELSVEENAWRRVEKPRLEKFVVSLQAELAKEKAESGPTSHASADGGGGKKQQQLMEEVRLKEVLLLRERSEKSALLQEVGKQNDQLKNEIQEIQDREALLRSQYDRITQSNLEIQREKDHLLQDTLRLKEEISRLQTAQEDIADDRKRLMKTLEAQQLQSIQSQSGPSSNQPLSDNVAERKIRELTARCKDLSEQLNERDEQKQLLGKESRDIESFRHALREAEAQHRAQMEEMKSQFMQERNKQQQDLVTLTERIRELEELLQDKEAKRRQAVNEVEGLKAALMRR